MERLRGNGALREEQWGGPAHHLRAVYILANGFVAQGYGSLVDLMVVSYLEFYENRCPDVG